MTGFESPGADPGSHNKNRSALTSGSLIKV